MDDYVVLEGNVLSREIVFVLYLPPGEEKEFESFYHRFLKLLTYLRSVFFLLE
jgi:hypothetical protein